MRRRSSSSCPGPTVPAATIRCTKPRATTTRSPTSAGRRTATWGSSYGWRPTASCTTSGARARSYALRFGARYCCTEYEEVLADPEVDVVVIANRHQHHAPQALAALRAGKHVFLEKPMALTEEECRSLWKAVDETGRHLAVGFNRRFAPLYREMKRQLGRRTSPAVVSCRVNSPVFSGSHWSADPSIGGAILGEACHFVDLIYWLLGSEPVSVWAFSLPATGRD